MMFALFIITLIIIIILIYAYFHYSYPDMTYIKSDVDQKYYLVQNSDDKKHAANMLAKFHQDILKLSNYLESKKNDKDYVENREYIEELYRKAPNIVLIESTQDSEHTSYSVNKGEQIVFCLRSKDIRNLRNFHDYNLIFYVVLHEIAHVANFKTFGHDVIFQKVFTFLADEAIKLGLYKKIDFNKEPKEYCGMKITDSVV